MAWWNRKKEEVKQEAVAVKEVTGNYTVNVITKAGANQTFIVTDISFRGLRDYIEGSFRIGVIYLGDGKYKNTTEIADITFKENK